MFDVGVSPSKKDLLFASMIALKDNINFKIYDVTAWLTITYNTHIAQYLSNYQVKYFSLKIMHKMRQGN